MEPGTILSYTLAFMGTMIFVASVLFYRHLTMNSDRAMASFQLNADETLQNFRMIYYGSILEIFAFLIYGLGGLIDMAFLLNIGRIISIIFLGIAFTVSIRWWRRFK